MGGNLPLPIRRQREVLYLPATGHSAVLGTAGSGKTTLALYRAAYLSSQGLQHSGKVLLLTFNNALVTYLNHLKPDALSNTTIETYHKFARGYLKGRGKMNPYGCICERKKLIIPKAILAVKNRNPQSVLFNRPASFFESEIEWLQQQGIRSAEEYQSVKRVGRTGTNLPSLLRPQMFEVFTKYVSLRNSMGYRYDWDDIASTVKNEFESDTSQRLYRHIIIDEGQDFSPEMLRSLSVAVPEDGSLTFFGDVAQQIYGQQSSWRSAGLNIQEVWRFTENYRNTPQIARLGLAIAKMPFFKEMPDIVEPSFVAAAGPKPQLISCADDVTQMQVIEIIIKNTATAGTVAVLFKNREDDDFWQKRLGIQAVKLHRDMKQWIGQPGVYFGTFHAAKGLEFDTVIIPHLEQANIPDVDYAQAHGSDIAATFYGRLLYVGCTRARTTLVLLYSGQITDLLPPDEFLYQKVSQ